MALTLTKGSIFTIEAKDLLATPAGSTLVFNKVSEHNRSEFNITPMRIEKIQRTANGTLRKYYVGDKMKFSVSWSMLPSYRTATVDGGWGAEDLRTFYLDGGKSTFRIRVNIAKNGTTQEVSGYEEYTVSITNFSATVVKRGLQAAYNVSLDMEEV
jgi:hypothetical protein